MLALSDAIEQVREEWLASSSDLRGPVDINDGLCHEFAAEVRQRLGASTNIREVTLADFQLGGFRSDDSEPGLPFNRQLLADDWPAVVPPQGLEWSDMDRLSDSLIFGWWTHIWLTDGALHYDAEVPTGVPNFFDLPLFRRLIARS